MKRILLATAAVVLASSAMADGTINIEGNIATFCGVSGTATFADIDMTSTALQSRSPSVSVNCNNFEGYTLTLKSGNGGSMNRTGGGASSAYQVAFLGSNGGTGTPQSYSGDTAAGSSVATDAASAVALPAAGKDIAFGVKLVAAQFLAGQYKDQITVTIAPSIP